MVGLDMNHDWRLHCMQKFLVQLLCEYIPMKYHTHFCQQEMRSGLGSSVIKVWISSLRGRGFDSCGGHFIFTLVISTNALRMRDGHQKGASHPRGPKSMAIVSAKSSSADSTVEFEEANVNIYR